VLDKNAALVSFAESLEHASIGAVEDGRMTKDLALCIHGKAMERKHWLNTFEFMREVEVRLAAKLGKAEPEAWKEGEFQ